MTPAQSQALTQILEIMREHFSAGIIVVETDVEGEDTKAAVHSVWHGGFAASLGLLEIGRRDVIGKCREGG